MLSNKTKKKKVKGNKLKGSRKELLKMSKTELAKQCTANYLPTNGRKMDLVDRLVEYKQKREQKKPKKSAGKQSNIPKHTFNIKNAADSAMKLFYGNEYKSYFMNRTTNKFILQQYEYVPIKHTFKNSVKKNASIYNSYTQTAKGTGHKLPPLAQYEIKDEYDTTYFMISNSPNVLKANIYSSKDFVLPPPKLCEESLKLCIIRNIPDKIANILDNKIKLRLEREILDYRYPKRNSVLLEKILAKRNKVMTAGHYDEKKEDAFIKKLIPIKNENKLFKKYKMRVQTLIDPHLNSYYDKKSELSLWVPAVFNISKYGTVDIQSDINNLSRILYGDLYNIFAAIFKFMLPMFEFIININNGKYIKLYDSLIDIKLKVIIKMQTYELYPNEIFEGPLHREGYDEERIIAVGIYYYQKSTFIGDDILEITRLVPENQNYFQYITFNPAAELQNTTQYKVPIQIKQGNCVVFNNQRPVYHQLVKLRNNSKTEIAKRKILIFMLVDPRDTEEIKLAEEIKLEEIKLSNNYMYPTKSLPRDPYAFNPYAATMQYNPDAGAMQYNPFLMNTIAMNGVQVPPQPLPLPLRNQNKNKKNNKIKKHKDISTKYITVNVIDGYNFIITYLYRQYFNELISIGLLRIIILFIYNMDIDEQRKKRSFLRTKRLLPAAYPRIQWIDPSRLFD